MRQMWILLMSCCLTALIYNGVRCDSIIHQTANQLVRNVTSNKKTNESNDRNNSQSNSRIVADGQVNQIIIFNIGDTSDLTNVSTSFRQSFDQETINYCNFDPELLSNKNSRKLTNLGDGVVDLKTRREEDEELSVNILLKGDVFNDSSQITVRIQFLHQQYIESSQLWYLVQAKSVCTNKVVGTWRLVQQVTTDTILCFKRDDTVFGHKTNRDQVVFDQTWLPSDTREDIYFVIAVFTDETYSTQHPIYFLLNSPIFKYAKRPDGSNKQNDHEYEPLCPIEATTTTTTTSVESFQTTLPVTTTTTTISESTTTTSISTTQTTTISSTPTTTLSTSPSTTTTTTTTTAATTQFETKGVESSSLVLTKSVTHINHFSMMSVLEQIENLSPARSILISLAARSRECLGIQNSSFTDLVAQKLTSIYKNVSFFDKVVISEIRNENCSMSTVDNSTVPLVNDFVNVTIQHYVIFNRPVKNITKVKALNALSNYISGRSLVDNLNIYDTYVLEDRNTPIRFNNPCSMYNHFKICQNSGVCKMSEELEPSCSCDLSDESFIWSGQYCEIKSERVFDSDKVNLLITISILATFVFVCLLVLILYIVYKKRQQKKMMKRILHQNTRSSTSNSSTSAATCLDCPSNGDYYSTHVSSSRVLSQHYPREITIASTPLKYGKSFMLASNEDSLASNKNYVVTHHHHHHPNMIVLQPFDQHDKHGVSSYHFNQAYHAGSEEFPSAMNDLNSAKIMISGADSKRVLKKSDGNNHPVVSIKSESFRQQTMTQLLPQTVEKQIAKNLQSIKIPSISMKLDNHNHNNNHIATNSYSVNEIWTNSSSKFTDTDSTSIPSSSGVVSEQLSLRDEDAWLPILSIAEEQIQKYEEEKMKGEVESFML